LILAIFFYSPLPMLFFITMVYYFSKGFESCG
jgi:hypothetical protein